MSTLRERCIEAMTAAVWPDGNWSAEAETMLDALLPVLSDAIKPHRWDMDYPDSKPPECGSSFADSFYSGVLHSARVVRELLPPVVRDPSQTSTGVDAVPDERQSDPAAQIPAVPTDLAASAPDRAADVAGTTGPAAT